MPRPGVTIYFVRHGQTEWNAERRFQGQLDVPLNDTGRLQAARNGAALATLIPDPGGIDFVSSPLGRAMETMEIVRRALALDPADYRTDTRLREIHAGAHQGYLLHEIFGEGAAHAAAYSADPWNFLHPGGESYAMLSARVRDWLGEVRSDTVVTAHGGVMRCLRRHVEGQDTAEAVKLSAPQERVMVIRDGMLDWI